MIFKFTAVTSQKLQRCKGCAIWYVMIRCHWIRSILERAQEFPHLTLSENLIGRLCESLFSLFLSTLKKAWFPEKSPKEGKWQMLPNVGRSSRWRIVASGARCSSSHRKPVGMRRMHSGNTVMEEAAVAGQIAKK